MVDDWRSERAEPVAVGPPRRRRTRRDRMQEARVQRRRRVAAVAALTMLVVVVVVAVFLGSKMWNSLFGSSAWTLLNASIAISTPWCHCNPPGNMTTSLSSCLGCRAGVNTNESTLLMNAEHRCLVPVLAPTFSNHRWFAMITWSENHADARSIHLSSVIANPPPLRPNLLA